MLLAAGVALREAIAGAQELRVMNCTFLYAKKILGFSSTWLYISVILSEGVCHFIVTLQ